MHYIDVIAPSRDSIAVYEVCVNLGTREEMNKVGPEKSLYSKLPSLKE